MMRALRRILLVLIGLAVVGGAAYGIWVLTRDAEEVAEQVIIIDDVGRATLQDTVVVRGAVAREDRFAVTAISPQRVTAVGVEVDAVVAEGDELFKLDGRPMLAVAGETPYWRPLDRFTADGPDVEMLEQFLVDNGYDPGTVDQDFTGVTNDAVEEWQEDLGYPVDGRFLPTDVAVQAWPATVGEVSVEVGDAVGAGQPLVAFVDDDLTVSVQVDPTDRSRLSVGLPATITVTATNIRSAGSIAELADAPALDPQGIERYAGEVAIDGELDLVEGAAVRVEVVLAEVSDALVVPVASVSRNGTGDDEVRILAEDGTIERVTVETGLTEGALVEIVSGLDGSEQVIVEVRQ
ncbi:MAG: peptidoglycan-binding protein [Actinomycetota bacterium]